MLMNQEKQKSIQLKWDADRVAIIQQACFNAQALITEGYRAQVVVSYDEAYTMVKCFKCNAWTRYIQDLPYNFDCGKC